MHPDSQLLQVALVLMEQTIANKQSVTSDAGYLNLGLPNIASLLTEHVR